MRDQHFFVSVGQNDNRQLLVYRFARTFTSRVTIYSWGRPSKDRKAIARAFVAKIAQTYSTGPNGVKQTRCLIDFFPSTAEFYMPQRISFIGSKFANESTLTIICCI